MASVAQLVARSCLLLLWLWSCVAPAFAQAPPMPAPLVLEAGQADAMLERHGQYWLERERKLDIDAVAAAGDALPWLPMGTGQQYRIDDGALWIRFDAALRDNESWYVVVQSSGIDRVQLFRQRPNGQWQVEEAGDTRPVSQWPVPGRVPTFELPPPCSGGSAATRPR